MKRRVAIALLTSCAIAAAAQQVAPDPDFPDVFFRLDAGKLVLLERQTATVQGKASGLLVTNVKEVSDFPGTKSTVRFSAGQPIEFIVRPAIDPSAVDPGAVYFLRKLAVRKNERELVIMSARVSPVGTSRTSKLSDALPLAFSRYGASSVKLTTQGLPPGEYAFSVEHDPAVFCFGVD